MNTSAHYDTNPSKKFGKVVKGCEQLSITSAVSKEVEENKPKGRTKLNTPRTVVKTTNAKTPVNKTYKHYIIILS